MRKKLITRSSFFCISAAALWIFLSTASQAHLLNMTEVRAELSALPENSLEQDPAYSLFIDLELDLLAELGSPEAYYQFSRLSAEEATHQYGEMLARLASSIHIQQQSLTSTPEIVAVYPPSDKSLDDFQSDFVWPKTRMQLQAELPSSEPIRIQFQTDFIFEEPIALSMHSSLTDRRKSRWLVAGQTSPLFDWSPTGDGTQQVASNIEEQEKIDAATLWSYVQFGFLHILPYGWDHLLFVLMLYLSVASTKQLILRISLFTLAHSITLGMASYRIVEVPGLLTETLISLSILAVAVLNLFNKSAPRAELNDNQGRSSNTWGNILVFSFGLLHGLGFASVLNELGQPMDHFLLSLLSFNIGVELGQLAFLAAVGLLIGRYKIRKFWHSRLVIPLSSATALVTIFLIGRILA